MLRIDETLKLPVRPPDGHKGSFGKTLLVAGSRGMSGAAVLAGLGGLRSGVGLVYLAAPKGVASIAALAEPSYLTLPLDECPDGRVGQNSDWLVAEAAKFDSAAIGPGLGQSANVSQIVDRMYRSAEATLVVDADGINALAKLGNAGRLPDRESTFQRILTPHPGEFARLTGSSVQDVQQDREQAAMRFAAENNVTVLLKGKDTVITDGESIAINQTGNSGMATGGSGDVLTGLIAGLLAQGLHAFDAARLGAHLHGLAGDLAAADLGERGMIASDLPRYLCDAWQRVEQDVD